VRVVWGSSAGAKRGLGYGPGASRDRVGNGPGAEAGAEKRNQGGMVGAKIRKQEPRLEESCDPANRISQINTLAKILFDLK
jgi:hypothetical protein